MGEREKKTALWVGREKFVEEPRQGGGGWGEGGQKELPPEGGKWTNERGIVSHAKTARAKKRKEKT